MSREFRYHPGPEQLALASTFNESLAEVLLLSRLHQSHEETADTWSKLQSLGLFGISVCETAGGSGLGAAEEALIAMQLGRSLAAPSIFATLGVAHADAVYRSKARQGRVAAAYRHGSRTIVVHDDQADHVLLRADRDTALYDKTRSDKSLDRELWLADLRESGSLPAPLARFDASALQRLRLIDAAALTGIAEIALEMSVAYAGLRQQFGRPIGSFQAVKHHCANMAIAARRARDQTSFAAVAIDSRREDAALQVDCALLVAGVAALENSAVNIQIHGGIGFSDEADPHLLIKRAQVQIALAGGLEDISSRIADAAGDSVATTDRSISICRSNRT